MPSLKGVRAVILCEGRDDYDFARGYLGELGAERFTAVVNPKGKGGGNAWVQQKFAGELRAFRAVSTHQARVLVAMTDGDGKTPTEQKRWLEGSQRMKELGQAPRQPSEQVLIIVPVQHLEAWFEFVREGNCDENERTGYKHKFRGKRRKRPKRWGKMLAERCQQASATEIAGWPPALQDACRELRRL